MFGFDQSIATLRAFGVVARAFDRESPLREGRVLVGLEWSRRVNDPNEVCRVHREPNVS